VKSNGHIPRSLWTARQKIPRYSVLAVLALSFLNGQAQSNLLIVVTASRLDAWQQDVLRVPSDITVIDRRQIEQAHARNVPELLRTHGNVMMRSVNGNGNTGELALRGFGENSGLRVLVMVDDQKVNRSDMGLQDWQQIPLEEIERIEILRGGQSVLYGNHALSGVIRITTKKGGRSKTKLEASAGSHGFQAYSISHAGTIDDTVAYTAGANVQYDNGARDHARSWSKTLNASLGYDLSEQDTFTLRTSGGETKYVLPGPLTYSQFLANPEQSANAGDHYTQTDNALITALYEGERTWGRMQLNAGVTLRNIDWFMSGLSGWNQQRGLSLSPKIVYGDEDDFSLSGGIDLLYDRLTFTGESQTTLNDATLGRLTTGPFVFAKKRLVDTVLLSSGVRYEYAHTHAENIQFNRDDLNPFIDNPWGGPPIPNPNYPPQPDPNSSFDGAFYKAGWSYEASALWEMTEQISLWCRYNSVYRYPALDESAAYQGYPLADPLNENLDPETGNNVEFGSMWKEGSWNASATFYYLRLDDEIAYDDTQKLNVNIGSTDRFGSDLQLAYDARWYGASCLAEWVSATFHGGPNDGDSVPLVPDTSSAVNLWIEPLSDLRITGTYTWTARQYQGGDFTNTARQMDHYGLFGVRADLRLGKNLSVFAKVDNLLDEQYASSAYNGGWYPGCGRAFFGGITVEF